MCRNNQFANQKKEKNFSLIGRAIIFEKNFLFSKLSKQKIAQCIKNS